MYPTNASLAISTSKYKFHLQRVLSTTHKIISTKDNSLIAWISRRKQNASDSNIGESFASARAGNRKLEAREWLD